jgi:cellulose synthase/poly-beta-1,6-N-acetylglucosamine synthase-like glycosyltransferase
MDAPAYTDAPNNLEDLMKQRRRWYNGFFFGEMTTIANLHNVLGFNGQTHGVLQRMKVFVYVPILVTNKVMSWLNPALMLTQMKYTLVYAAWTFFDTPAVKSDHNDVWRFFTNDPSSMGFQSFVTLSLLFLIMFAVLSGLGA